MKKFLALVLAVLMAFSLCTVAMAASDTPMTAAFLSELVASEGYKALVDALASDKREPLFVNGMAQPIFPFTPRRCGRGLQQ